MSFYVTGGTLHHDTPSYVARQADADLYDGLTRGEFCYVLTSRQMGKSSLMNRTAVRLRAGGTRVVILDLTALGQNVTVEQWYDGMLLRLGDQLGLEDEIDDCWLDHERLAPLQRFLGALGEVVLPRVGVQVFGCSGVREEAATAPEHPNTRTPCPVGDLPGRDRHGAEPAVLHRRVLRCDPGVLQPADAGAGVGAGDVLPAGSGVALRLDPGHPNDAVQHRTAHRAHRLQRGGGAAAGFRTDAGW